MKTGKNHGNACYFMDATTKKDWTAQQPIWLTANNCLFRTETTDENTDLIKS